MPEEIQPSEQEKPKKESFFSRLFKRKKPTPEQPLSEPKDTEFTPSEAEPEFKPQAMQPDSEFKPKESIDEDPFGPGAEKPEEEPAEEPEEPAKKHKD